MEIKTSKQKIASPEVIRKSALAVFKKRFVIVFIIVLISSGLFLFAFINHIEWLKWIHSNITIPTKYQGDVPVWMFILMFALAVLIVWVYNPVHNYKKWIRSHLFPSVFENFFNEYSYKPDGYVSLRNENNSLIVPDHNETYGSNYLEAKTENGLIKFSRIRLIKAATGEEKGGKDDVFTGYAYLTEFNNKNFLGKTILLNEDNYLKEKYFEKIYGLKKANFSYTEFENKLDAYTSDQVEARYLLDPIVLEGIISIERNLGAKRILASFYDQKFLLLIMSKNGYIKPPSIFKSFEKHDPLKTLKHDLKIISTINAKLNFE